MTLITPPTTNPPAPPAPPAPTATDYAELLKPNLSFLSESRQTKGLDYASFAFNKGFSNTPNVNAITPDPNILDSLSNKLIDIADGFTINQLNEAGQPIKSFSFSLLPAIESSVSGRQVPEIKPGILKRSSVNVKTFNLPGGVPAFQSLGLEPTMLQLVGLLIGSESIASIDTSTNAGSVTQVQSAKGVLPVYTPMSSLNAYQSAIYFEQQLVQNNRPVEISISANNSNQGSPAFDPTLTMVYKAILQNVRYFIARQDRIYYSIDALLLDYPNIVSLSQDIADSGEVYGPSYEDYIKLGEANDTQQQSTTNNPSGGINVISLTDGASLGTEGVYHRVLLDGTVNDSDPIYIEFNLSTNSGSSTLSSNSASFTNGVYYLNGYLVIPSKVTSFEVNISPNNTTSQETYTLTIGNKSVLGTINKAY